MSYETCPSAGVKVKLAMGYGESELELRNAKGDIFHPRSLFNEIGTKVTLHAGDYLFKLRGDSHVADLNHREKITATVRGKGCAMVTFFYRVM